MQSHRDSRRAGLAALAALAVAGCTADVKGTGDTPREIVVVSVEPSHAQIAQRDSLPIAARVAGTQETAVDWTVQEADGGTVSSTGVYVAPAADGTFHVVATSRFDASKRAIATIDVRGPPPPPPPADAPMTTASRTSGVAPLAVFFDAVDTVSEGTGGTPRTVTSPPNWPFAWTSGVLQPADMEGAQFEWSFGDPTAGVWATDGLGKNTATGFTAAHVFENPGTYVVGLRVTWPDGRVDTYQQTIAVTEFAGTTHYASASGTGDGTSPATPQSLAAGWAWVNGDAGRRLLLNRGDTFTSGGLTAGQSGMIVGAYGTGAAPRLLIARGGQVWYRATDITLMDLQFEASAASESPGLVNDANHRVDRFLALRLTMTGWGGVQTERVIGSLSDPNTGVAWVETAVDNRNQATGMYVGGHQIAVMGCTIANTASHNLRVWLGAKAVVSHNKLQGGVGTYQHALKFHSHEWEYSDTPESRWATISDNEATYPAPWVLSIGPQNAQQIERVSHVVIERNRTFGDPGTRRTQAGIEISARHVMVRNNVLDGTGASSGFTGVYVRPRGIEPTPYDIRVLNNTVVRRDAGGSFSGVSMSSTDLAAVRNNIAWAPSASSRTMLSGSPTNLTLSNNLPVETDPQFTRFSDQDYDYTLASASSPAVDAGVTLGEVRADHRGTARPIGVRSDMGAFECF